MVVVVLLAAPSVPVPPVGAGPLAVASASLVGASPSAPGGHLVSYSSSVDGWPLSYEEWLPTGYTSGSSYPLAVYLHGEVGQSGTWVRGGVVSGLMATAWGTTLIQAARSHGFLLIALNTRTGDGFYVNSPFTGPQQTDVLDAIAHEEEIRSVASLYLVGDSMGSVGALQIADHLPGAFAGIGSIEGCTDVFEMLQWRNTQHQSGPVAQTLQSSGGQWPNGSAVAAGLFYYESAARFFPGNLTNLRLYYAAGGQARSCPSNASVYAFQQANNTILRPSCLVAARVAEPANCTGPLATLSGNEPGSYLWRYDYVANGTHNGSILDAADMLAFWAGSVPGGVVCGLPGATPVPCARPGVATSPFTTQYYDSSVDGALLSYCEWLPSSVQRRRAVPCPSLPPWEGVSREFSLHGYRRGHPDPGRPR